MPRLAFLPKMGFAGRLSLGAIILLTVAAVAAMPLLRNAIAWTGDPAMNTALCTAAGDQGSPVAISDGYSGSIVTWQDHRNGTDWDIYAQRTDPAGAVQWLANGAPVCAATYDQTSPAVVSDGQGGAIIAWQDARGSNCDIYAQRIDAAGIVLWTANGVPICTASYDQVSPVLVSDGEGGALVIWQDRRNGSDYNLYVQKVNASGKTQWTTDGVGLCQAATDQTSLAAAGDSDGGVIVAWQDLRNGNYDVYVQRMDSSCTPLWTTNGVSLCTLAGPQVGPVIVEDGNGGAIIAWQDGRGDAGYDIYAQRVNSAGAVKWAFNGLPVCAAAGDQSSLSAVSDGDGGAVIAWQDARGNIDYDIYSQRIDTVGAAKWTTSGVPACTASQDQRSPIIVSNGSVGPIIVWQDARSTDSGYDIYGQSLDSAGGPQWTAGGVPISTAPGDQGFLSAAIDGSGGAIIAWQDSRGSDKDIYAQRVRASGALSNPPGQPGNLSPADRETGVSLTPALQCSEFSTAEPGDSHAASQWRVTAFAGEYSTPVFDSGADGFRLRQVTLDPGMLTGNATYYWQVRHQGRNGLWSPWSTETSFTTRNRVPDQPAGVSPADGTTGIGLTPTLQSSSFSDPDVGDTHAASQWRITTTPGDYTNLAFLTPELTSDLIQVTVSSGSLVSNTTYYWQVRYKDSQGGWSVWSEEMGFTTLNRPPERPAAVSPVAGATGTGLAPTLESSAFFDPDSGDTHEASQWQVTANAGDYSSPVFADTLVSGSGLTSITITSGVLNPSTTYYWWVRYQDSRGAWSDWSAESSFTTRSGPPDNPPPDNGNHPPDRPTCVAPTDGADGVSVTPTLEASPFHDPDTGDSQAAAQWQVTTKSGDYEDPIVNWTQSLNSTAFPAEALRPGTTYYWRVRHQDNHQAWSEWSEECSFTTEAEGAAGDTNRISMTSWLYLAGIITVAALATAVVFWRNSRAARLAAR